MPAAPPQQARPRRLPRPLPRRLACLPVRHLGHFARLATTIRGPCARLHSCVRGRGKSERPSCCRGGRE
eukprot:3764172-Alexandrium_andersonii.AAC.1